MRISKASLSFCVNSHYTSIIGPTGVGKSSVSVNCRIKNFILTGDKFINIATDEGLKVNNSSSPCTKEIAYVRSTFEDSREVVFVDTPPFPDLDGYASVSAEEKVGNDISEWVKET